MKRKRTYIIREKTRVCASPAKGLDQEWTEWQVVEVRRGYPVRARCGSEAAAKRAKAQLERDGFIPTKKETA